MLPDLVGNCWPENVDQVIRKLKRDDHISVTWTDASQSYNVSVSNDEIPNKNVETICIAQGSFYSIQKGEVYNDLHLIIQKDSADGRRISLQSIPLCLVKIIQRFRKEDLMNRHLSEQRSIMRFEDGSVKMIG